MLTQRAGTVLQSEVLKINSDFMAWCAEPTAGEYDTQVVETLVKTLDANAKAYLEPVDSDERLASYSKVLRRIGGALLENAEKCSSLADPFTDECLREMVASSCLEPFKRSTPEQFEARVNKAISEMRMSRMNEI